MHIPYRDSKLTRLLARSLGGSGITLMVRARRRLGRGGQSCRGTGSHLVEGEAWRGMGDPAGWQLTCISSSSAGRLHLPVLALPLGDAEHATLRQPCPEGHHQTPGQQGTAGRGCGQGALPRCWDPPEPPPCAPRCPGRSCCKPWRKKSMPCSWKTSPCASSCACPWCQRGARRSRGPPRGWGHGQAGEAGMALQGCVAPLSKGSSRRREPQLGPASMAFCGTSWWRMSS